MNLFNLSFLLNIQIIFIYLTHLTYVENQEHSTDDLQTHFQEIGLSQIQNVIIELGKNISKVNSESKTQITEFGVQLKEIQNVIIELGKNNSKDNSESSKTQITEFGVQLKHIQNVIIELGKNNSKVNSESKTQITEFGVQLIQIKNVIIELGKNISKVNSESKFPNCADILKSGNANSEVHTIYPYKCCPEFGVKVWCDQEIDGGGWTVIQRRQALPVREDFYRTWLEYERGFGNITGEFWLGLKNIHALTSNTLMELRIDLGDWEGNKKFAKYEYFDITDASDKYRLHLGSYSGSAKDSFTQHNGQRFSTKDQDNDSDPSGNCSKQRKGAWWYNNCAWSNLNGYQHVGKYETRADGIYWSTFNSDGSRYSLKTVSMLIRPKFNN